MHFNPIYSLIAAVVILFIPTVGEIWNDRNGEVKNEKLRDWLIRSILTVSCAIFSEFIRRGFAPTVLQYFYAIIMIVSVHFLIFDYAIVIILKKNGVIRSDANPFTYLGKTANYPKWWIKAEPMGRFAIRIIVFAIALVLYF